MSYDLFTATSVGDLRCVKEYLNEPFHLCNINSINNGGWTSLMYAAYYGHAEILELLLKNGADVNCRNYQQQTSLMLSSMCGNDNCCMILLKYRARIDDRDEVSWTSLVYAVSAGYPSVVELLIQQSADVNVVIEKDKMTPFLIAAASGHEQVLKLLSEGGANQYVKSSSGKTASGLAVENGHTNLSRFFETGVNAFNFNENEYQMSNKRLDVVRENLASPQGSPISPFQLEPPFPNDLKSLLSILGLSEYFGIFQKRKIDMFAFLKLNGENLKDIGINKLGPRCKMNSAISRINYFNFSSHSNVKNPTNNQSIVNSFSKQQDQSDVKSNNSVSREQLMFILSPLLSLQLKSERMKCTVATLKEKAFRKGKKDGRIHPSHIAREIEETELLAFEIQENLVSILKTLSESTKASDM